MNRTFFSAIAGLLVIASTALAQVQMPTPLPEVKKLDYFVGAWKTEGNMKAGPYGPGGQVTGTDTAEWMRGNFFIVVHSNFKGAMGSGMELSVLGYDPAKKVYTFDSFNSSGEHETATGTLDGDTWTWNSESQGMKWRYTEKMLSPTSYNIKFEMAAPDGTWSTMMEATSTKQ